MKSDKQKQAKADLLHELESLRAQLAEAAGTALENDAIPLLLDKVEQALAEEYDEEGRGSALSETETKVLPGQQPLFEKANPDGTNARPASARPSARGENPFLPKHIRDHLDERRRALAEDTSQAADFSPATADTGIPEKAEGTTLPSGDASIPPDPLVIIDELIAEYMPRIEAELRLRLARKLKLTTGDHHSE